MARLQHCVSLVWHCYANTAEHVVSKEKVKKWVSWGSNIHAVSDDFGSSKSINFLPTSKWELENTEHQHSTTRLIGPIPLQGFQDGMRFLGLISCFWIFIHQIIWLRINKRRLQCVGGYRRNVQRWEGHLPAKKYVHSTAGCMARNHQCCSVSEIAKVMNDVGFTMTCATYTWRIGTGVCQEMLTIHHRVAKRVINVGWWRHFKCIYDWNTIAQRFSSPRWNGS